MKLPVQAQPARGNARTMEQELYDSSTLRVPVIPRYPLQRRGKPVTPNEEVQAFELPPLDEAVQLKFEQAEQLRRTRAGSNRATTDTIFIQIASYRDRELIPTLQDAIIKATYPERLHFGIVWQYGYPEELDYIKPLETLQDCQIKLIPADESLGVCWARSITQHLRNGEKYTLQIDSHMRFVEGWDELLIQMIQTCPSAKPVLTAYAPAYEPPNYFVEQRPTRLAPRCFTPTKVLGVHGVGDLRSYSEPQLGAFISGHFFFADASFIDDIPYDPDIYFLGEEVLLSVRAWTNGWDIYHPHTVVCWHYYGKNVQRFSTHWADHKDWSNLNAISESRFRKILGIDVSPQFFGRYGLGNERSLDAYESLAGVNFKRQFINRRF